MKRRWLPDNVSQWHDRHGKPRYRFRKVGMRDYHFRSEPGTPEFMQEYHDAKSVAAVSEPRSAPYTYDALIASFYRTPRWLDMKPSSQKTYRGIIERFRQKNGSKDVRRITTGAIDAKLTKMASTPAAANNLRKALARLHRHAIKLGWLRDNPVTATDRYKDGKGWHCWTEAEIAQYEARWPLGTRERLAMALLLHTALRRSDMVSMGRQHRKDGAFHLRHEKNDSDTVIPIAPQLAEALDAMPDTNMTYLVTEFGKPFTGNGFGNWFRDRCDMAALPHCSAHGLRKAISRRLAESGATSLEGKAVTGHKRDEEFEYYAAQASQKKLAEAGMNKVVANHPAVNLGEP